MINITTNKNLGRKRFMPSDSLGREWGQGHGDWNSGPETEAEALKDCWWPASHGSLNWLFIQPRNTCPDLSPPTVFRLLPRQSSVRRTPLDLPTSLSDGGIFSAEDPSSQMTVACIKLSRPNKHTLSVLFPIRIWCWNSGEQLCSGNSCNSSCLFPRL